VAGQRVGCNCIPGTGPNHDKGDLIMAASEFTAADVSGLLL